MSKEKKKTEDEVSSLDFQCFLQILKNQSYLISCTRQNRAPMRIKETEKLIKEIIDNE